MMAGYWLRFYQVFFLRLFCINYSKEVAKTKREREEMLQRKLQIAQAQFQQAPCEEVEKILDECKANWKVFMRKRLMD